MINDTINLVVETKDGRPLRTYTHEGKTFIESREGTEYSLRVKNKTGKRIMAVIAVDGINVVNGKIASDKPDETGYVLGPYEEHLIKGYRIDENNVASFKFVARNQGYAQEKSNDAGCGVVAVRVWAEKEKAPDMADVWKKLYEEEKARKREKEYVPLTPWSPLPYRPIWYYPRDEFTYSINNAHCSTNSTNDFLAKYVLDNAVNADSSETPRGIVSENPFSHASSWGSELRDAVREVTFEVGVFLSEVNIFYAPKEGLKLLGIDIEKTKAVAFPQSFKREYCAPPKNWTGQR